MPRSRERPEHAYAKDVLDNTRQRDWTNGPQDKCPYCERPLAYDEDDETPLLREHLILECDSEDAYVTGLQESEAARRAAENEKDKKIGR
jgi:hypothetical protein